ncbi:pilus assembly protein PilX [Variovorax paradoxus]|jgi:type IV pilus assembly protein PilX|uniref:Pilus assembly protein PilX n=1 Tax=Variovorax paradoxus TaxID=34073 RepID=A0A0D0M296_VARPD|nr:PilX N-terminal domain-containing pilus assembly protein [Variovorax paradoxus]KIQ35803.1 pilus assembly protein PilX [Variovorax paradoxus]
MSAPRPFLTSSARARQRGAALFVAMIMMLLVLVLAVVGMRTITLESRIAGNMLQSQRLQETADGALRDGERAIQKYGLALSKCADGATTPYDGVKPCFISEARTDALGLQTSFGSIASASGFTGPYASWYPRYISTVCPKGSSATSALDAATGGCMEFYELNAQATSTDAVQNCGPLAFCLRSAINLFIK